MQVRVVETNFQTKTVQTRIPFKFGVQVLQAVELAELSVVVENTNGERALGRGSDLLVPKWFEKNPETSPAEDMASLAESAETAGAIALALGQVAGPHAVFELWSVLHAEHVGTRNHLDADALVRGFGAALVERALIDATTRLAGVSFNQALRTDMLGFRPRRIIPEAAAWTPDRLTEPANTIQVRHTIGMLDPLSVAEIPQGDRVLDGLPQALEEDIDVYGLRWFKVKVCGDPATDTQRLRDIARVVSTHAGADVHFTLDGNEQCRDLEAFSGMLEDLRKDSVAGPLVERIVLIEQPLPRRETFEVDANADLDRLSKVAPVIIDEADTDSGAFQRAVELGYAGTSIKACKGVFRAIANRALIDTRRESGVDNLFQSAEDLTNLGSIPLQQDLALQATLGMGNVERNGHHYFRGLDHLSEASRIALLQHQPALYEEKDGLFSVRISRGMLELSGVIDGVGFGGFLTSFNEGQAE